MKGPSQASSMQYIINLLPLEQLFSTGVQQHTIVPREMSDVCNYASKKY